MKIKSNLFNKQKQKQTTFQKEFAEKKTKKKGIKEKI